MKSTSEIPLLAFTLNRLSTQHSGSASSMRCLMHSAATEIDSLLVFPKDCIHEAMEKSVRWCSSRPNALCPDCVVVPASHSLLSNVQMCDKTQMQTTHHQSVPEKLTGDGMTCQDMNKMMRKQAVILVDQGNTACILLQHNKSAFVV